MVTAAEAETPTNEPALVQPIPPSTREEMDAAVAAVAATKDSWLQAGIAERLALIDACIVSLRAQHERWVTAELEARSIDPSSDTAGEEWAVSSALFRQLRMVRQTLAEIQKHGQPVIPGKLRTRADGQVVAPVLPRTLLDRIEFAGTSAEIWLQPGMTAEEVSAQQARAYRDPDRQGATVLILGAGNVSALVPGDFLTKIFGEKRVVVLKLNEVNKYLGPIIADGYAPLIDAGVLRLCYGGAEQGGYLANHEGIDELHITGSHHTYEAIVFGPGAEGQERKRKREPLLTKPFTGELGAVSPTIVVPGEWSASELDAVARHLAAMLVTNAGFQCLTTRVIITHAEWPQREALLTKLRELLAQIPPRAAYYPGAPTRHADFIAAHPDAERFGDAKEGELPWTLVSGLDPASSDDICFTTEAFCGLYAETAIAAPDEKDFLTAAVRFANDNLWGTLTSTILARPAELKRASSRAAIDQAIADLRYGTVGINVWGYLAIAMMTTSWGAFPGHDIYDIQSGTGVVNNWLLLEGVQKSVVHGAFHTVIQPSAITPGYRKAMRALAFLERERSLGSLMGVTWAMCKMDFKHTMLRMIE